MKKIRSNMVPERILHLVFKKSDFAEAQNEDFDRKNLNDDSHPLQVAALRMPQEHTFKPHQHVEHVRETNTIQETWIVVQGEVRVFYYDLDGSFLRHEDLQRGDCMITYEGGHTYESRMPGTLVYEVKNGPYLGQEADKKFIQDHREPHENT